MADAPLTVADLDVVTAFFVALGLEVEGRTFVEGEFLDTVCGIPDSRTEIVMLRPTDGGTRLELSSFVRPDSVPGSPAAMANELGLRNVAFEVNDLQAAVDWASTEGYGLVGGIGGASDLGAEVVEGGMAQVDPPQAVLAGGHEEHAVDHRQPARGVAVVDVDPGPALLHEVEPRA
jgi:catechol 2,3-dioxygenase-like lactoylglutathione lyase family enzyme